MRGWYVFDLTKPSQSQGHLLGAVEAPYGDYTLVAIGAATDDLACVPIESFSFGSFTRRSVQLGGGMVGRVVIWAPRVIDLPAAATRAVTMGPATAPPLVVVPDPPNVLEHHRETLELLAHRHRIVAFELPGFGRSRLHARLSFTAIASAVTELLEHLELRDVTLEMSCVGAFIGMQLAAARPDLIARLVLVQTATLPQMQAWARSADVAGLFHTPVLGQALCKLGCRAIVRHWYRVGLPPAADLATRARYTAAALASLAEGASFPLATGYQALARATPPPLAHIHQPALLLFGAADRTHARTAADVLQRSLPHASLELLPTCGHFPTLEAPEQYATRLATFVAC